MTRQQYQLENGELVSKLSFFHPLSRRLHVVLLIMMGLFSLSLIRMNIGISMTCMVNSTAIALKNAKIPLETSAVFNFTESSEDLNPTKITENIETRTCSRTGTDNKVVNDYGGTLDWDANIQGYIFAAGFWGSLFTIIPSGLIADVWSPVKMLQIAGLALILTNGLTPFFALNFGPWSLFGLRLFMGLFEGIVLPSVNKLASQWIPNEEKSTALSMYTSGNQLGGILGIPFFALLCSTEIGWPLIFYWSSAFAVIWLILWRCFVNENPAKCKNMSEREKAYLESFPELKSSKKNRRFGVPPFKAMFTSPAFLALILCSIGTNMVASIIQIYLPTFIKEVLFLSPVNNGFYSAAPPFVQFFSKIGWSIMIDHCKAKGLSPTVAVKISQAITNIGSAVILIIIGYTTDCNAPYFVLFLLCLLGMCFSTATSGFFTSMVSLAPSYTGIITSISFVFGITGRSLPSLIVPYFNKRGTLEEWRNVFFVTSALLIFSTVIFVLFGSGHPQEWGIAKEEEKEPEKTIAESKMLSSSMTSI